MYNVTLWCVRETAVAVGKQYYECVYSCLSYAACKSHLSRYIVICSLPGSTFSALSHKHHDFRKKKLTFFTVLSETFLILRRIQRDIIINIHRSSCKVLVILVRLS
jgi:hypothetical protein